MVDITILEVHLPDGQFNAPFSVGGDTGDEREAADASAVTEDTGEAASGNAIAALLVLLVLAALAWYLRRGGDDEAEAAYTVGEKD